MTSKTASGLTASATLVAGGALVGGIAGVLTSTAFVPNYIPDNKALFRIGAAWMGAVEGATIGLAYDWSYGSALLGGAVGLTGGAVTGIFLDDRAPNYGRVAAMQSAAAMGMLAGILAVPALKLEKEEHTPLAMLGGLNLGIGAGLALAFLPDQRRYGPEWQEVLMVDLGTAAGLVAGAMVNIISTCLGELTERCEINSGERHLNARYALVGGGIGLVGSWLLTRRFNPADDPPPERPAVSLITLPTVLPLRGPDGRNHTAFGLTGAGRF